jgi:hypothetical protein
MLKEVEAFRLCCIEGEVMVHDGRLGWMRGFPGMEITSGDRVAIKTGGSGRCEVADEFGKRFAVEPNSLYVLGEPRDPDLVDTLPRITMEIERRRVSPSIMRQRLLPVC